MVQELLSRVLKSNLHIVFILLIVLSSSSVFSQSVLLPADIVIVSVNSSGDSFDFIPLVPLQAGTSVWFSNGVWDSEGMGIIGNEIEVELLNFIDAGTSIHINEQEDSRIQVRGRLDFTGDGDRIFAYQKDGGVIRVIYCIGWGSADIWNAETSKGSEIPVSISRESNSLLHLGLQKNYQYYLRNGASGTPLMLAGFVTDPSKWRGKDSGEFPNFGTAFRILKPPVVLFDESVSTVKEGESISLNAAIYEHDGSRITVDVIYNTANSIADTNDINGFHKYTFNFTGLIGNAVYGIEIPLQDDRNYEGTENAFFELQNLSRGSLGDFVSHVSFIQDNDLPSVEISTINYSGDATSDFIEIQNNEGVDVDISGWQLMSKNLVYEFEYGTSISAYQSLRVLHPEPGSNQNEKTWLTRRSGTLDLKTRTGELVSDLTYRLQINREEVIATREVNVPENLNTEVLITEISSGLAINQTKLIKEGQSYKDGWYVVNKTMNPEMLLSSKNFIWNEVAKKFEIFDEYSEPVATNSPRIVYLTKEQWSDFISNEDSISSIHTEFIEEELAVKLSATDFDENGIINGAEGFNFLENTTNNPIVVADFVKKLEEELGEGKVYPHVYLWNNDGQGWLTSKVLKNDDLIPAQGSFWVRVDSLSAQVELSVLIPPFVDIDEPSDETDDYDSILGISIQGSKLRSNFSVNFFEREGKIPADIINPALENELRVMVDEYLFFGANTGLNWNSQINLEMIENQKVVFPLSFETSESGLFTLSINEWRNIPSDWKIILEDLELGKEYEINRNWTLEFEYSSLGYRNRKLNPDKPVIENESLESEDYRFNLAIIPPGVEESESLVPDEIFLGQNYPNPFNPTTTIAFYLPESVPVKLSVFNVVGQPVAVLAEGTLSEGDHTFEWDASGLPSGMYIYQLEVGNKILTQKMTLVK